MTVDFHVHSKASDGTSEPSEIAYAAKAFAAVALTDHDNTDGIGDFLAAGSALAEDGRSNAKFIAGAELSIDPGEGFDKFHLLAIGIDPGNEGFKALLEEVLRGRNERNARILENFRRIGIEIDEAGLRRCANGKVLARPHFAQYLVEHGKAPSLSEAFARYLLPDSPAAMRCYEVRYRPAQERTFEAIHGAGGLCIMAHPKYWKNEWKTGGVDFALARKELSRLKEAGLDGVESLYQANTQEENEGFTRIAMGLGLLMSAGSDFHGLRKPGITLGMEVGESFIAPLLERL